VHQRWYGVNRKRAGRRKRTILHGSSIIDGSLHCRTQTRKKFNNYSKKYN
jgi:hypothetical protein